MKRSRLFSKVLNLSVSSLVSISMILSPAIAEAKYSGNHKQPQSNADRFLAVTLSEGFQYSNIPGLKHYKVYTLANGKKYRLPMNPDEAMAWVGRFRELRSEFSAQGKLKRDDLLRKIYTQLQLEIDLKESFEARNDSKNDIAEDRRAQLSLKKNIQAKRQQLDEEEANKVEQSKIVPVSIVKPIPVSTKPSGVIKKDPVVKVEPKKPKAPTTAVITPVATSQATPAALVIPKIIPKSPAKFQPVGVSSIKHNVVVEPQQLQIEPQDQVAEPPPAKPKDESPANDFTKYALWIENGPMDEGHVEWIDKESCIINRRAKVGCRPTIIPIEESPFLVTDFYSRNADDEEDESTFEAIRSDGVFKKDGSNIISHIPKGSLVTPLKQETSKYQSVHVISVANFYDDEKPAVLAKQNDSGYIYKKSLQHLVFNDEDGNKAVYSLSFSESNSTERAKLFNINLDESILRVRSTHDGKGFQAIEYCQNESSCSTFILFDVLTEESFDADRPPVGNKIFAISPSFISILDSVTARVGENDTAEEEDKSSEKSDEEEGDEGADTQGTQDAINDERQEALERREMEREIRAKTAPVEEKPVVGGVTVHPGTQDKVVCFDSGKVKVREMVVNPSNKVTSSKEIDSITVSGTPVLYTQSWSQYKTELKIDGKAHTYEKVQYGKDRKTGWISQEFIKLKSECKTLNYKEESEQNDNSNKDNSKETEKPEDKAKPEPVSISSFLFPLFGSVPCFTVGCGSKGRWFGARRRKGKRLHGGSDLIIARGSKIRAVGDGTIIMGTYHFYEGTYAVEQRLSANGMVIRYGEIGWAGAVKKGPIKKGASVGTVGGLRMLHGEQYSGKLKGPLSRDFHGKYWRRDDIIDPTNNWKSWLTSSGLSIIKEGGVAAKKKKKKKK